VNGTLQATTAVINGGTLSGGGTISGDVENVGGIATASDPGIPDILTITGNYTQDSGGILEAYLNGKTAGTGYSQLDVNGVVNLDGTLDVDLSFNPTSGEDFYLVEATGGIIGTFATLDLPTLTTPTAWN
jgi:hypothetical protein